MARNSTNQRSADLNRNLRQSINLSKQLAVSFTSASTSLSTTVSLAGALAENIAKASKATRAFAGPIALVAAGLEVVFKVLGNLNARAGVFQETMAKLTQERGILQAQLAGNELKARIIAIESAGKEELAQAEGLNVRKRDRVKIVEQINAKTRESVQLARQEAAEAERLAGISRYETLFEMKTRLGAIFGSMESTKDAGKRAAMSDLVREMNAIRAEMGMSEEEIAAQKEIPLSGLRADLAERRQAALDIYDAELSKLKYDVLQANAQLLGSIFGTAIADGLVAAFDSGRISDAFKGVTGSILIGLGEMLQTIGTKAIAASALIAKIAALIGTPPGLAAGLAAVALGTGLKALGQSMTSGSGRRGAGGGGSSFGGDFPAAYGGGGTGIIDRGLINPLNPFTPTVVTARTPIVFQPVIIGPADARAQRQLLEMVQEGMRRAGHRFE